MLNVPCYNKLGKLALEGGCVEKGRSVSVVLREGVKKLKRKTLAAKCAYFLIVSKSLMD